jgi:N-methylhydantoinase B
MEEYSLRPDSGGAGQYRGGLGLDRQYRLLADTAVLQLRADRTAHAPYGLFGGQPGDCSRNFIDTGDGLKPLPGKATLEITRGTVIRHEQAGGGGYGPASARDTVAIRRDLRDGKISAARALTDYGFREDQHG